MARERTLLERVAASREGLSSSRYEATATDNPEARMESVRRQLAKLLNARQGMSEAAPDYGLPALTDLLAGGAECVRLTQDAIRATIEKYEPRLRRVRVSHQAQEGGGQTLVFRIDAVLVGRGGEHRVWYETAFSPTGEAQVSE